MTEGKGEIVIYDNREGDTAIEVKLEGESLWLTIGLHIKNIYEEEELHETATTEVFSVVNKKANGRSSET